MSYVLTKDFVFSPCVPVRSFFFFFPLAFIFTLLAAPSWPLAFLILKYFHVVFLKKRSPYLSLALGFHTCWLSYFPLEYLWRGRMITWLPKFLECIDNQLFLPMVLWRARDSRFYSFTGLQPPDSLYTWMLEFSSKFQLSTSYQCGRKVLSAAITSCSKLISYKVIISFQIYPNCIFAMIFGFLPSYNEFEIEQLQSTTFIADTVGRFKARVYFSQTSLINFCCY